MTHCQVRETGRGSVWHIARSEALVVASYDTLPGARHWSWYHMTHCQVRGTGRCTVWHISTHGHVGNEYKISTNSEIIKHLCFCVDRKCKITYFYVTNNPFELNVTLLFLCGLLQRFCSLLLSAKTKTKVNERVVALKIRDPDKMILLPFPFRRIVLVWYNVRFYIKKQKWCMSSTISSSHILHWELSRRLILKRRSFKGK